MEIKDSAALVRAIEEIAPYCAGWALSDKVGDINRLASARQRILAYKEFEIPKKSGGVRRITAPTGRLKGVLKCLSQILASYYEPHESAHGFIPGRSVASNADVHVGKNYVLNIDLKDFFPSSSSQRIARALRHIGLSHEIAELISRLATIPTMKEGSDISIHALPQGSPCSPILSNMVCIDLDRRLSGLARRFRLDYTRYADDLTFSSNRHVYSADGDFLEELRQIVNECGFVINEKKTRLQKRGSRQEVTGILVNTKRNSHRSFRKNLRAAVFSAETNGCTHREYMRIMGGISYLSMLRGKEDTCVNA
jgi:retron-type reverse transcriptase